MTTADVRHILVSEGIPWNKSFFLADQILKLYQEAGYRLVTEDMLLTPEEIRKECDSYAEESRRIWNSSKSRQEKVELVMGLKSVYERVTEAQLKKVMK